MKKGDKLEIWNWPIYKTQLPVTCGNKEGTLNRDKLPAGSHHYVFAIISLSFSRVWGGGVYCFV